MGSLSQLLGPREAGAAGPPSTTGDIQWSKLDPKTFYLYNTQPSSATGSLLPPQQMVTPQQQDAISFAGQSPYQQAFAEQVQRAQKLVGDVYNTPVPETTPADFTDPKVRRQTKRQFKDLNAILRDTESGKLPQVGNGYSVLEYLLGRGAITMDPGGAPGARTALPFPGGSEGTRRLVGLIDRYRDFLQRQQ